MAISLVVLPAQSAQDLRALTVPGGSLPEGCGLTSSLPEPSTRAPVMQSDGRVIARSSTAVGVRQFPSNPWFGTEYRYIALMRPSFEGVVQMPDGPPLDRADAVRLRAKLAGDITEGYHASYDTRDDGPILVQAVRYADATSGRPSSSTRTMTGARNSVELLRILRGSTVILITGNPQGECFRAVRNYIESVK